MNRLRWLRGAFVAAVVVAAQLAFLAPASAHKHPTPVELDSPGVVFVETAARVEVTVVEHNKSKVVPHVKILPHAYTVVLKKGSGFAVDPTGDIVTSGDTADVQLQLGEIYAVNRAFQAEYGIPMPSNPFARHRPGDVRDGYLFSRLQQCYTKNRANEAGGCVIATTREITVYPYVTSQPKYGNLPATLERVTTTPTGSVAVLKVTASTLPTVNLAKSAAGAQALSLLGFTGRPSDANPLQQLQAHLVTKGATQLAQDAELPAVDQAVGKGLAGGPVIAESGQVVGFFTPRPTGTTPGNTHTHLVSAADIQSTLTASHVSPALGPTYFAYESAGHNFKNKLYTAAIPGLTKTLEEYPGHFLATQQLAQANKLKNTAADLTGKGTPETALTKGTGSSGGSRLIPWLLALLALGAAAGILFLLRRRRNSSGKAASPTPSKGLAPASAVMTGSGSEKGSAASRPGMRGGLAPSVGSGQTAAGKRSQTSPPSADGRSRPQATPAASPSAVGTPKVISLTDTDGNSAAPAHPAVPQHLSAGSARAAEGEHTASGTEKPRHCTDCGHRAEVHHRFCKSCGAVLG